MLPSCLNTFYCVKLFNSYSLSYTGAILTITASIQMFASVGSTILFNKVYHPEAEVNGHHYNAGIVFWITAGLWAAVVPLVM